MKAVIIGAGISGLMAAWRLQHTHDVTVLEASSRVGGWIQTHTEEGAIFERGPRSIRLFEEPAIIRELGLELIPAATTTKFLAHNGALQKLPTGFFEALSSPLGRKGLWAMMRYPFSRKSKEDESVEQHFQRRVGQDFVDTFIDPLMRGIWGAHPSQLSFQACFPKGKRGAKVYGIKGGLQMLPDAIAKRVQADIRLNTQVSSLHEIQADLIINTVGGLVPEYQVPQTSFVTVSLGYKKALLRQEGFGFLASSKEEKELYGVVFDSSIFPSQNGPFQTRLSVMMGGGEEQVLHYIEKYLGIKESPDFIKVHYCKNAIPAFPVGYLAEREKLMLQYKAQGITLQGAAFDNPSIGSIMRLQK